MAGAGDRDVVVLAAVRRKERTYPELVHRRHNRARFVVRRRWRAGGLKKRGASSELCWSFGALVADGDLPETFDEEADFRHAGLD